MGRRSSAENILAQFLHSAGIPIYATPEECAWAMYSLAQYAAIRRVFEASP